MTYFKLAFVLCSVFSTLWYGCDDSKESPVSKQITFVNYSPELIYAIFDNEPISAEKALTIPYYDEWHVINTEETHTGYYMYVHKGGSLYVLIYKPETLKKYTREELIENDIADYRYTFTYDELEARDFTITFTGD